MPSPIMILGPGRMGVGLATAALLAGTGRRVTLIDLKQRPQGQETAALETAREEIASNLALMAGLGRTKAQPKELLSALVLSRDLNEDLEKRAFIFEALPEKIELKRGLLAELASGIGPETIVASTTSTLDLGTLARDFPKAPNLIITHWLNPAFLIPLVEVARNKETGPETVQRTTRLLRELGKIPVVLNDSPGFIVPRIQTAAMNEAVRILEEGVASPAEIDTAIKAGFGFRLAALGLLEFIDLGGLDILFYAGKYLASAIGEDRFAPPDLVAEKMAAGRTGPRTGQGIFNYSGVEVEEMFKKRYRGMAALLEAIQNSPDLSFEGGLRSDESGARD